MVKRCTRDVSVVNDSSIATVHCMWISDSLCHQKWLKTSMQILLEQYKPRKNKGNLSQDPDSLVFRAARIIALYTSPGHTVPT